MAITRNGVTIECVQGDISNQSDMEAVVNAANAQLKTGGGVAGALHRAAGPKLAEAGQKYAPIEPGEAVITSAFNLPNEYIIHALGPVHGRDEPSSELLQSCYQQSLERAEENGIETIAFPALSTGVFGYPMEAAAEIALKTVIDKAESNRSVRHIRFVLWSDEALRIHGEILESYD